MKQPRYVHLLLLILSLDTVQTIICSSSFGKTHFILTQPTRAIPISDTVPYDSVQEKKQDTKQNTVAPLHGIEILFSPDDNVRARLLQLIEKEQGAICIAIFMITDPEIANALCHAK